MPDLLLRSWRLKSVIFITLILNHLTSRKLKRTQILAETLTGGPYYGGLLKRRLSVMICQKLWIFIWSVFLRLQVWWLIHRPSNGRHLFRPLPLVLYFRLLEQLLRQGTFDTFRRYNPGGLILVERPWNWQWNHRFKTWWKWIFFRLRLHLAV